MRWLPIVILAACSSSADTDVRGPFTGTTQRFAIDRLVVPHDSSEASLFADDLDGDGKPENQLGNVTGVLASTNDLTSDVADMIASGALASSIEIQADDLGDDDSVGVTFAGADGDAATVAGGLIIGGVFASNRTRQTHVPGRAVVRLPVFTNADPIAIDVEGLELDLTPDGAGGYDGFARGGVREEVARDAAYAGLVQMAATEPARHLVFERQIDTDHDGVMSRQEVEDSVIALLVTADIHLFDGDRYAPGKGAPNDCVSIGLQIHLVPCASGACAATGTVADHCRDRVRDVDETDVDCGGSCQPCATQLACSVPADCQSQACTGGSCAAPTCSDGVRDGFESDVDCGGECGPCGAGKICAATTDCTAPATCDQGVATTGTCVTP